jgi:hypothetical protein
MTGPATALGYRLVHGELRYSHAGRTRGHERFTISVHGDGSRILRAMSEIFETRVLRDVSLRVGPDWCPRDVFVRLTVSDEFRGSGWFTFDEDEARGEALHAPAARLSQQVRLARRVRSFGTHPIQGDAWHAGMFDLSGPPRQHFTDVMISSYAFDGATGPELLPLGFGLELLGTEEVPVPAGSFRCRRFRFLLGEGQFSDHPPYEIWVTADGDNVLVRAEVGAPRDLLYELVRYEQVVR